MRSPSLKGAAIIGAGVIFHEHARAYQNLAARVRLVGIADTDEQKLQRACEQFFLPVSCSDYHALLARDDIDIISVCTPPNTHETIVCDALRAGKYVICEKPLATTLAAVDRIADNCVEHLNRLSIVYQLRYDPLIERLHWLRSQGYLGQLVYGHVSRLSGLQGTNASQGSWWGSWNASGGGVVITQFIHHLDQLIYIFGKPIEVGASFATTSQPIESDDSFGAQIRFENGALVTCGATVAAAGLQFSMDVVGSDMSVHIPWQIRAHSAKHQRQATRALASAFPSKPSGLRGGIGGLLSRHKLLAKVARRLKLVAPPPPGHARYLAAVLDAIDLGEPLPLGLNEARLSLELCMAIYQASLTGTTVRLPLDPNVSVYRGITAEEYHASLNLSQVSSW